MSAAGKYRDELIATAKFIATPGKGILAADESTSTIGKRFDNISLENVVENRQAYRELLFTTPNWGDYCSGVILYIETFEQSATDGTKFVDMIKKAGVIPGVKTDKGLQVLPGTDGETSTKGLDSLAEFSAQCYAGGARFAKFRTTYKISATLPSELAVADNAHTLARYAAISQENGLVPIVEPELLMDGSHSMEESFAAHMRALSALFKALVQHNVLLEGIILKPSMVIAGKDVTPRPAVEEVANRTLDVLLATVPPAVPGVTFLSGGQSEEEATAHLNAMNASGRALPWTLSFSYGRALQASAIKAWGGKKENVEAGQNAFLERAKANSAASQGKL